MHKTQLFKNSEESIAGLRAKSIAASVQNKKTPKMRLLTLDEIQKAEVPRRVKYKLYRLSGYNMMASALNAGYSRSTADRARANGLEDGNEKVSEWLERIGVTQKALAEYLKLGLDANKVINAVVIGKDADEKTNDFIDVPDWQSRHKYLETALKLKGALNDNPQLQSIVFNISTGAGDTPVPAQIIDVKKEETGPVAISVAVGE